MPSSVVPPVDSPPEIPNAGSRIPRRLHIFTGIGASYLQSAVMMFAGFVTTSFTVRYLGDKDYGLWITVWTIINYLRLGSNSMTVTGTVRAAKAYARKDDREVGRVLVTSSWISFGCLALTMGLLALVFTLPWVRAWWLRGSSLDYATVVPLILILVTGTLASQPAETLRLAIRSFQRVDLEQYVSAIFRLVLLMAGLGVLACGGGVISLAIVTSLCQVGIGIPFWFTVRRIAPSLSLGLGQYDARLARSLLAMSLQFFVISLGGALIWGTDNVLISAYLGAALVTPFAVAMQLMTISTTLLSTILGAVVPTVTSLHALDEEEKLRGVLLAVVKVGLALSSLLGVGYLFFGEEFLRLWVGAGHVAPRPVLLVLLAVCMVRMFAMLFEMVVLGTLSHRTYAMVVIAEGVLNLVLSIALVGRLGLLGVALGTLISHVACTGWYLPYKGLRIVGCGFAELTRRSILPVLPAMAAALATARLFLLLPLELGWVHLVIGSVATTGAYVVLFVMAGLGAEERALFRPVLRKLGLS